MTKFIHLSNADIKGTEVLINIKDIECITVALEGDDVISGSIVWLPKMKFFVEESIDEIKGLINCAISL